MSHIEPVPSRRRFPRRARLTRQSDVVRTLRTGRRVADSRLLIWARPNQLECTRLGLTVSRKHGPAVARNRIKRVLREAFRLVRPGLPGGLDLMCRPHLGATIELEATMESLTSLAERARKKLAARQKHTGEHTP